MAVLPARAGERVHPAIRASAARIAKGLAGFLACAACGGDTPGTPIPAADAPPTVAAPASSAPAPLPEGFTLQALPDGLAFGLPPRWTAVEIPPAQRQMRKAMLRLPAAAGAPDDAELVVFFFGAGQGGSVEANLARWCGQFEVAGGGNPRDAAKVASRTVNGLRVTTVDLAGTYVAAVMPGAAEKHDKPGYRLLAAIVETAVGPFFLKCVGPDATLAAESAAFDALVGSVQRAR